jgi:hypothetical protein
MQYRNKHVPRHCIEEPKAMTKYNLYVGRSWFHARKDIEGFLCVRSKREQGRGTKQRMRSSGPRDAQSSCETQK